MLLKAAQPNSRAQKFLRIDRVALDTRLIMQVRSGGAPGGADAADRLPDADILPNRDIELRQMAVAGGKTIAVIDFNELAIAAIPASLRDFACGRSADRVAHASADIQT